MSELHYLNFFATTAFVTSYSFYIFFNAARKSIFNNIKEIDALKIRIDRLVYCHEQLLTKIISLENKFNSLNNKTVSVDKETLTDKESLTDKENLVDNKLSDKDDSINIDNWTCMDKSINVNDACEELKTELFITIPRPKSWFTQMYS